jgi:hypothetical protein
VDDTILIVHVKNDGGRRSVQEVNAPLPPLPLKKEPAHATTRNADQIIVAIAEGKEDQINQSLAATLEVTAQAQKALAVPAERIECYGHGSAVGPQNLVAFVLDLLPIPVFAGITSEYDSKRSCHSRDSRGPIKWVFSGGRRNGNHPTKVPYPKSLAKRPMARKEH